MNLSNRNILNQFFSNGVHKYFKYVTLPLITLIFMLCCVNGQVAHGAASNSMENGIEAFKQGDFNRARSVLSQYIDTNTADTKRAQVYMFAMEETPKTMPSTNIVEDIIHKSAAGDNIFKVMEARLHLLGLHPQANKQKGLKILESLAKHEGYAAYTLGLYFEGTLDGIKRDEAKAKGWYGIAKGNHYVQAILKLYMLAKDAKISRPVPVPYAEPVIIEKNYRPTQHPQKILEDSLPKDLGQKHIQTQTYPTHPIHPVDQISKDAIATGYPFLASASYWGNFLYQRKMSKL